MKRHKNQTKKEELVFSSGKDEGNPQSNNGSSRIRKDICPFKMAIISEVLLSELHTQSKYKRTAEYNHVRRLLHSLVYLNITPARQHRPRYVNTCMNE